MADRICLFCNKDFKYPSRLKKHHKSATCFIDNTIKDDDIPQPIAVITHEVMTDNVRRYHCSTCEFSTIHQPSISRHSKKCVEKTTVKVDEPVNNEDKDLLLNVINMINELNTKFDKMQEQYNQLLLLLS